VAWRLLRWPSAAIGSVISTFRRDEVSGGESSPILGLRGSGLGMKKIWYLFGHIVFRKLAKMEIMKKKKWRSGPRSCVHFSRLMVYDMLVATWQCCVWAVCVQYCLAYLYVSDPTADVLDELNALPN
jgi:hypothetical protein